MDPLDKFNEFTCFLINPEWFCIIDAGDDRGVEWVTLTGCISGKSAMVGFGAPDGSPTLDNPPSVGQVLVMLYEHPECKKLVLEERGAICVAKRIDNVPHATHKAPVVKQ